MYSYSLSQRGAERLTRNTRSFWDETGTSDRSGRGGWYMTLEEVAKVMGVTRERIRQIEAKAIRKLQHPKRSILLEPFSRDNFDLKRASKRYFGEYKI